MVARMCLIVPLVVHCLSCWMFPAIFYAVWLFYLQILFCCKEPHSSLTMYCDTILHDKKYLILDCNIFLSIVMSVVCVLFVLLHIWYQSLDRTVCIVTRLWARCRRNHDSIPDRGKRYFLQSTQIGSRAHPAWYMGDTSSSFTRCQVAGAWNFPLTSM